jgi:hypothetical protein
MSKKPKTRSECADVPRPCPFISCRYNLSAEITPYGEIKTRTGIGWKVHNDMDLSDHIAEAITQEGLFSCALDYVDEFPDGNTLVDVGDQFLVSRERARQLEQKAVASMVVGTVASGLQAQPAPRVFLNGNGYYADLHTSEGRKRISLKTTNKTIALKRARGLVGIRSKP